MYVHDKRQLDGKEMSFEVVVLAMDIGDVVSHLSLMATGGADREQASWRFEQA